MIFGAYGFMIVIFSLYESLKYRTRVYLAKSVGTGLCLVTVLYILVVISSISLFGGNALTDAKANLMNNVNNMYKNDKSQQVFVVTEILRFLFSMILSAHVIFIFFLTKDTVLLCLDEMLRNSFSKKVEIGIEARLMDGVNDSVENVEAY